MNKVLVTGAGGFIGSHLTELLVAKGYYVKAFVRYNGRNDWGWLETSPIKGDIEIVTGDIRDYDSVHAALKGCFGVFHLAALIGIPYSYVSPLAYIKTNIEGTYNILESARQLSTEQVLITSTSETYGTAQYIPINEKHPAVGQSPYSATKIAADQLAISYYRSFGMPVKIVRPFNTYGPRQSARAIIPTVISQILAGKTELNLGNLSPTRDLTFVADTVNGFFSIFNADACLGTATNIGMNQEISVKNLVHLIAKLLNREISIKSDDNRIRTEKSEVERLWCDNSIIRLATGWSPHYTLELGLTETIEFIKRNLNKYKPDIYNI